MFVHAIYKLLLSGCSFLETSLQVMIVHHILLGSCSHTLGIPFHFWVIFSYVKPFYIDTVSVT